MIIIPFWPTRNPKMGRPEGLGHPFPFDLIDPCTRKSGLFLFDQLSPVSVVLYSFLSTALLYRD